MRTLEVVLGSETVEDALLCEHRPANFARFDDVARERAMDPLVAAILHGPTASDALWANAELDLPHGQRAHAVDGRERSAVVGAQRLRQSELDERGVEDL